MEVVSEHSNEEEKDTRRNESRHMEATDLCEQGFEDDRQFTLRFCRKSIEGEGAYLCRDDPKSVGTTDLYAE
jgi:hypothetical protein